MLASPLLSPMTSSKDTRFRGSLSALPETPVPESSPQRPPRLSLPTMSKTASRLPFLKSPPPFSTTPLQATFEHRASPMTAAQGLVDVRFWASREPWEEGSGGRRGVFLFIPGT